MTSAHAFTGLCLLWFASEAWIGRHFRSGDRARARDRGSLRLLLAVAYASIAIAVWLASRPQGRIDGAHGILPWTGIAMMAGGMALRWWSIRRLARFFTVDVAIRPGHRLVRDGPYRVLRHPSYTGALATFYGFALALGNARSLLAIVLPVTAAFAWRIRVEEQVLAEAFPDDYPAYARTTWRLFPFLW